MLFKKFITNNWVVAFKKDQSFYSFLFNIRFQHPNQIFQFLILIILK